jgi:hypothetical protein
MNLIRGGGHMPLMKFEIVLIKKALFGELRG